MITEASYFSFRVYTDEILIIPYLFNEESHFKRIHPRTRVIYYGLIDEIHAFMNIVHFPRDLKQLIINMSSFDPLSFINLRKCGVKLQKPHECLFLGP